MRSYKLRPKQATDYAIAVSNRRSVSSALPLPQISVEGQDHLPFATFPFSRGGPIRAG
jgi:hypothetical protein